MNKYRVHLHSKPDAWAPYSGYVDVSAKAEFLAEDRAIDKLMREFPERPRTGWLIDRVEQRWNSGASTWTSTNN